jgi:hypothetical protein
MFRRVKTKCKSRNIDFDLKLDDIVKIYSNFEGLCPYCENKMIADDEKKKPSLDRIDNSKGYVQNNCLLVCLECNHQKHYLSKKQIINMYKYLVGI